MFNISDYGFVNCCLFMLENRMSGFIATFGFHCFSETLSTKPGIFVFISKKKLGKSSRSGYSKVRFEVHSPMHKGGATARRLGGGGRGPFEVDSFHATPIGIMLNAEKFAGDRSPVPPPPRCRRRCPYRPATIGFMLSSFVCGWPEAPNGLLHAFRSSSHGSLSSFFRDGMPRPNV